MFTFDACLVAFKRCFREEGKTYSSSWTHAVNYKYDTKLDQIIDIYVQRYIHKLIWCLWHMCMQRHSEASERCRLRVLE